MDEKKEAEQLEAGEILARKLEERLVEANIDENYILTYAARCSGAWYAYFSENITRAKQDMLFAFQDQWLPQERQEFSRLGRPAMQFNKVADPIKKIVGEFRKNKPDLMVRAATQAADQAQIDIRADLVRHYCYKSQNDLIYQEAFKWSLGGGYAALQVDVQYENPMSFNQEPTFRLIKDPLLTIFDPAAELPHKGDGNFCARIYLFSPEEFAAKYPYIQNPVSYSNMQLLALPDFFGGDFICVLDFYMKEWYTCEIYGLSNGESVTKEEWEDMQPRLKEQQKLAEESKELGTIIKSQIPQIINKRWTEKYRIMNYQLTNNAIIDFRQWPSKELPIIFVDGNSDYIDGKQVTKSFVKDAKDAQKFVNYVASEITGEIKNRRREQWIGTRTNITGYEVMWENPETYQGILLATPDPKKGGDPMPTKLPEWQLSQTLLAQFQRGSMDIKEILGFHDELAGQETNAISGIAVQRRQSASSMSAYVYTDNLNQAIEQCGRVVLDMLPNIMGEQPRIVTVKRKDGKTKVLSLNNGEDDKSTILDNGMYDVEIDAGPSFAVQKESALNIMMGLLQANPQAFPLMADMIAANVDLQFMPQLVERFKTLVPPAILAKENGEPEPPAAPPSPQDQMMQLQIQGMQKELEIKEQRVKEAEQKLQIEAQKNQISADRAQIERIKAQLQAMELQNKTQSDAANRAVEIHRSNMGYNESVNRLIGDLHDSAANRHHESHNKHLDRVFSRNNSIL
jgi:hypothetical protein